MSHLAAHAAAHAGVVHVRYQTRSQRISRRLYRQRWATRQTDAGTITGADIFVYSKAIAHHALTLGALARQWACHATLAIELTFTFGDDDPGPA
jgi:hypothetical protein